MLGKADVVARVCGALLENDRDRASALAAAEYPFVATTNAGRAYTEVQSTRIYRRDGFLDRYTGDRLVFPGTIRLLSKLMPSEFPTHPSWKMSVTHMVYWDLFPTIDHVIPVARGGADSEENWVTTSMVRNAAKSNWTLEELGWTLEPIDPVRAWDGLIGWFVDYLSARPEHLSDKYIARWLRVARATTPVAA
jgi:5-methylcytosine-specific restriction endonuclease McrA